MKKIYKIILLIIIPLLVACGISVYSYSRYKTSFVKYYMDKIEYKNTEEKIEKYVKFYSDNYDLYYEEDVKNDNDKKLFKMRIYRVFNVTTAKDSDGNETTNKEMYYLCALYNINYGNTYYSLYDINDKNNTFVGYLPSFDITIKDKNNEDNTETLDFETNTEFDFEDYNYVGYTKEDGTETKRYSDDSKIFASTEVKFAKIKNKTDYSLDLNIVIKATDGKDDEVSKEIYSHDFNDFYTNAKRLSDGKYEGKTLEVGYDQNIYDAGYAKFAIGKYVWWQALIAIVLTLVITGSTTIIWETETNKEKEANSKK